MRTFGRRFGARVGIWGMTLLLLGALGPAGWPEGARGTPQSPTRSATADTTPAPGRFRLPVDGWVTRRFEPPPQRWSAGHRGVDLAAAPGATVRAAGAGMVYFAGRIAGRGVVSVAHDGGLRTTYEPVEPAVSTGDRVAAGDPLGVLASGHLGCPEPACLHWGLRRGEEYLDPLSLLGVGRVRLLPVPRHHRRPVRARRAGLDPAGPR
ncbi:MAG TPA: M23 family metallopeptidase [Micromonosporaceae bacterium]